MNNDIIIYSATNILDMERLQLYDTGQHQDVVVDSYKYEPLEDILFIFPSNPIDMQKIKLSIFVELIDPQLESTFEVRDWPTSIPEGSFIEFTFFRRRDKWYKTS